MNSHWASCKNILCIRLDNMGDLIMSVPAMRALRETFGAKITVLTSSMAKAVTGSIAEIDEVIIFDVPWVKSDQPSVGSVDQIINTIKSCNFDAAVIFTVYSQNPLPAVMLAYLAGIPRRLAYCRENPYQLLTDWYPDPEPYSFITHQVSRDLDLVKQIGAITLNDKLCLTVNQKLWPQIVGKLSSLGFDSRRPWLIIHAGVSEIKRRYPKHLWTEAGKQIIEDLGFQVILTGSESEKSLTDDLQQQIGEGSFSVGGLLSLKELITLVEKSLLMISVNTGTIHIAAAVNTPVIVLYALTNPQHTPWKVPCKVLPFGLDKDLNSKNEVIKYVNRFFFREDKDYPSANEIVTAVEGLLNKPEKATDNELFLIDRMDKQRCLL